MASPAPVPVITQLEPRAVPINGGPVRILGTGLEAATAVLIGGEAVSVTHGLDTINPIHLPPDALVGEQRAAVLPPIEGPFHPLDPAPLADWLLVIAPAHPAGPVPVVVLSPGGDSAAAALAYLSVPTITALFPALVPLGGATVTITGTGLADGTTVLIDGMPAAAVDDPTDTTLRVVAPRHASGQVPVVARGPGGDSAQLTLAYLPAPTVDGISPTAGPLAGTTVTIHGRGLGAVASVTVDNVVATEMGAPTDTSIRVAMPPRAAGTAAVVVHTPVGDSAPATFTYVERPLLMSLSPSSTAAGQTVVLTGRNLDPVTSVVFGGVTITELEHSGLGTAIDVRVPPGAGIVDVVAVSFGVVSNPLSFVYV